MSKAFLSSSSSQSTMITETSCDFYPDNSNQDRERNLFFFSRKNERSCYQKKQDYVIDKLHRRLATKVEIAINRNLTYLF